MPLGVHKVVCAAPGLRVTTQVHRRSVPQQPFVLLPGQYVEVLETQVHGDRVRGRICWEQEEAPLVDAERNKKKKSLRKRTSRMLQRTARRKRARSLEGAGKTELVRYEGWISLQWAKDGEGEGEHHGDAACGHADDADSASGVSGVSGNRKGPMATDEDAGPWVRRVSLKANLSNPALLRLHERLSAMNVPQTWAALGRKERR